MVPNSTQKACEKQCQGFMSQFSTAVTSAMLLDHLMCSTGGQFAAGHPFLCTVTLPEYFCRHLSALSTSAHHTIQSMSIRVPVNSLSLQPNHCRRPTLASCTTPGGPHLDHSPSHGLCELQVLQVRPHGSFY